MCVCVCVCKRLIETYLLKRYIHDKFIIIIIIIVIIKLFICVCACVCVCVNATFDNSLLGTCVGWSDDFICLASKNYK